MVLKAQLERQRLGQHPFDTLVDAACRPEALDLIFPPQWPPLESSSAKFSTQAAAHFYKESFIGTTMLFVYGYLWLLLCYNDRVE